MDYNSIHAPGVSNFSSPSPHRMPTVSAAQALQDLKSSPMRCISTGISLLDCALQNRDPVALDNELVYGGVSPGKLTEVYGPPGIGKTALGMQLAASALYAGESVTWVDASHPLPGARLFQILSSYQPLVPPSAIREARTPSELATNLTHFSTPTLAHLIALLAYPTPTHPPPNTSLIVIDSFSTIINNAFPRTVNANVTPRNTGAPNPSARKFPILKYLVAALQKLAATRNIAIVVFSQCVTKMRSGISAVLVPSINTTAWEQGLGYRVALFRDWGWVDDDGKPVDDVRLAQVIKAEGISVPESRPRIVGFTINKTGLSALILPVRATQLFPSTAATRNQNPISISPEKTSNRTNALPQKRKISATDLEIPDSDAEDDEDYGWAEEDEEELPPPPPQWQGSEDILIPPPGELADEEVQEDDAFEENFEARARQNLPLVIEDSEDELAL